MRCALRRKHAGWVLILAACNPALCPGWGFRPASYFVALLAQSVAYGGHLQLNVGYGNFDIILDHFIWFL